jgi:anaerobic magnesium-protoporphyrin IX monomethyl ester cyclase
MDVLFTHSYIYRFDAKQWQNKQPYPPYGTIYAAAVMREAGYDVGLFDVNLISNTEEILPVLKKENPRYLVIYDDGFNYLTKMCLSRMREVAMEFIQFGKKQGCKVIISSSDSTDHFEKYLNAGADFILLGEAELTLRELISSLEAGATDYSNILGLAYHDGNRAVKNPSRPVIKDLDSLPDPAWDLIDISAYKTIWLKNNGYFGINIATTRGCPYKCNWCAKPIYGNRYNSRSPERVVKEMEMLVKQHGAEYFWVCDDIFGLKPSWVQRFRDCLKEKNLKVKYKVQSRVDLLLEADNIDALSESGLYEVWVGAESGSQKILDAMDKGTQVEEIFQATRLLKEKKVRVAFFLQFGYLGETKEDISLTIKMLHELMPDDIGISVSYPLPGTKFYETVKENLHEKQNWKDSDDLDLMFPGTYKPDFYKKLHRYVHKSFRGRQAIQKLKSRNIPLSKKLKPLVQAVYFNAFAWIKGW